MAAACQTTVHDPPDWINNVPLEPGYLYGVGCYVGALHKEDNQGYAMENARGVLADSMGVRIVKNTDLRETESSSSMKSETLVSSEHVITNSELVSTWVDIDGRKGRRGTVYVLMRIARM